MMLRALVLAMMLACAAAARAQVSDVSLARVFREIRAAEIAEDAAALESIARAAGGEQASERVALARAAIESRRGARTASALRAAEDSIEARRAALAEQTAPRDAAAARELLLEGAEDLLLRGLAADASDAMIAVGLPTMGECDAAGALVARVDRHLGSALLAEALAPGAALATDPLAFRANFLAGLAALVTADLESAHGRSATAVRARAADLLARAARSELPAPAEIAAILSLARARALQDPAARAPLLGDAAKSQDAVRAFVARVEQWRDRSGAPFPKPVDGLEVLALAAECRQRAERPETAEPLAKSLDQAFRAAVGTRDEARKAQQLAAALAPRVAPGLDPARDAMLRAQAVAEGAPPALLALMAVGEASRAFLLEHEAALRATARDAAIAPFLAVPLARELQAGGRGVDAARVLVEFVLASPKAEGAREALDIALEITRAEAERSDTGEVALARALDAAIATYPADPLAANWQLARVDLALFPRWTLANADSAAQYLLTVPTDPAHRPLRELRGAEIDGVRAGSRADDALAVARKAEVLASTLPPTERDATARAETLRARMLLVAERPSEALACAENALREPAITAATARRAATAWLAAALARENAIAPPHQLAEIAARQPEVADAIRPAVAAVARATEDAWIRGDAKAARSLGAERLMPLANTLAASPATVEFARAAVLGELCGGKAEDAFASADRFTKRWPSDRALLWLRAEACRAQIARDASARARAFAFYRELSPLASRERDEYWWRAQLAQLELLADDAAQREPVLARINRLAALDATLGSPLLARRFEELRARCAKAPNGGQP